MEAKLNLFMVENIFTCSRFDINYELAMKPDQLDIR